jgi:hypothetical protein
VQITGEVGIDSVSQVFCLANVDHAILRVSPTINTGASRYVLWFIRSLHGCYLILDLTATGFFTGGCLTALVAFFGVADFVVVALNNGFRNLAV